MLRIASLTFVLLSLFLSAQCDLEEMGDGLEALADIINDLDGSNKNTPNQGNVQQVFGACNGGISKGGTNTGTYNQGLPNGAYATFKLLGSTPCWCKCNNDSKCKAVYWTKPLINRFEPLFSPANCFLFNSANQPASGGSYSKFTKIIR